MSTHKIVILDDDHYPEGRVSLKIIPEFEKRGVEVVHYKTFKALQDDIFNGTLDRNSLFVIDSSLEDEPDHQYYDFKRTVPSLIDRLNIRYKHIIPASGGVEGKTNNDYFFTFLENIGRVEDWGQRCLENFGLTGDPVKVVDEILGYHDVLYPGEIKREVGLPSVEGPATILK